MVRMGRRFDSGGGSTKQGKPASLWAGGAGSSSRPRSRSQLPGDAQSRIGRHTRCFGHAGIRSTVTTEEPVDLLATSMHGGIVGVPPRPAVVSRSSLTRQSGTLRRQAENAGRAIEW
jgi:hypothetical protein